MPGELKRPSWTLSISNRPEWLPKHFQYVPLEPPVECQFCPTPADNRVWQGVRWIDWCDDCEPEAKVALDCAGAAPTSEQESFELLAVASPEPDKETP